MHANNACKCLQHDENCTPKSHIDLPWQTKKKNNKSFSFVLFSDIRKKILSLRVEGKIKWLLINNEFRQNLVQHNDLSFSWVKEIKIKDPTHIRRNIKN